METYFNAVIVIFNATAFQSAKGTECNLNPMMRKTSGKSVEEYLFNFLLASWNIKDCLGKLLIIMTMVSVLSTHSEVKTPIHGQSFGSINRSHTTTWLLAHCVHSHWINNSGSFTSNRLYNKKSGMKETCNVWNWTSVIKF